LSAKAGGAKSAAESAETIKILLKREVGRGRMGGRDVSGMVFLGDILGDILRRKATYYQN
jgi:hypothetical protein